MKKFCDPQSARLRVYDSRPETGPDNGRQNSLARLMVCLGLVPVLAGMVGCVSTSPQKGAAPKSAAVAPTPDPWRPRLGKVALVDKTAGFALLDIGTAPAPAAGTELRAYTQGGGSSDLTVSAFQRRPFLIANIRKGHPAQGDAVVLLNTMAPAVKTEMVVAGASTGASKKESRPEPNRLVVPEKNDSTQYLPILTEPAGEGVIPGLPTGKKSRP